MIPNFFKNNHEIKIKIGLRNQNKNREFKKRSFSITKSGISYNDLDGPYGSILDFDYSSEDLALNDHFFDVENYAY